MGYALGETVKDWINWHWAFFCVVPPGLALGVWCFFMRDPPRGQTDRVAEAPPPRQTDQVTTTPPRGQTDQAAVTPPRKPSFEDYLYLLRIPSYTLNTLGMAMMIFAIGGLAFWMPEYLEKTNAPKLGPASPPHLFLTTTPLAAPPSTLP